MKRMNDDNESEFGFIEPQDRLPEAKLNSPRGVQLRLGPTQQPPAILYHLAMSPPPRAQSLDQARVAASFNKTDAGNGSKAICRVSNVLRSPSPDPKRSPQLKASHVSP